MSTNQQLYSRPKYTTEQPQWQQLLSQIHQKNIPIYIKKQNKGIFQLYANHIPKDLYVKHQYSKLKIGLEKYIRQFQLICHEGYMENNMKKSYKSMQGYDKIIRLEIEEIVEELGYLNLKPISEILQIIINIIERITTNFLPFVKSLSKTNNHHFQRKIGHHKQSLQNYCIDCRAHRQDIIIRDIKRKLNINKITNVQRENNKSQIYDEISINASTTKNQIGQNILNDVSNNYTKIRQIIQDSKDKQDQKKVVWNDNINKVNQDTNSLLLKFENGSETDLFMKEKENYLAQINALLEGREVHQTSNTHAYSYLVKQIMQIPNFQTLHEDGLTKKAQQITQKIQNELFQQFLATLSQPLKLVFKKVLASRNRQFQQQQEPCTISVQVQTVSIQFEKRLKELQKQLLIRTNQLLYIKSTKQQLQKKYFQKYQQQRENQKQIHQNFKTRKQLQKRILNLQQQKDILKSGLSREVSMRFQQLKSVQQRHARTVRDIKNQNQAKFTSYRQRMNQEVSRKLAKARQLQESKDNAKVTSLNVMVDEKIGRNEGYKTSVNIDRLAKTDPGGKGFIFQRKDEDSVKSIDLMIQRKDRQNKQKREIQKQESQVGSILNFKKQKCYLQTPHFQTQACSPSKGFSSRKLKRLNQPRRINFKSKKLISQYSYTSQSIKQDIQNEYKHLIKESVINVLQKHKEQMLKTQIQVKNVNFTNKNETQYKDKYNKVLKSSQLIGDTSNIRTVEIDKEYIQNKIVQPCYQSLPAQLQDIQFFLQSQFSFLKHQGIIDQLIQLKSNQQKEIEKRLSIKCREIIISKKIQKSRVQSRQKTSKNHKTLKDFVSKSLSKLNPSEKLLKQDQAQSLKQQFLKEIKNIETFSAVSYQDLLDLFGSKQKALEIENNKDYFGNIGSISLNISHQNNRDLILIENYFKILVKINSQKFQEYIRFLTQPVSFFQKKLVSADFISDNKLLQNLKISLKKNLRTS